MDTEETNIKQLSEDNEGFTGFTPNHHLEAFRQAFKKEEETKMNTQSNSKSNNLLIGEDTLKALNSELVEPKMDISHPDFLKSERLTGETDKQYKVRRIFNKMYLKHKKRNQMLWISKDTKQPVFDKENTEMKDKPIGYKVSKGFTYNKEQVKRAVEKYNKEKQDQEILAKLEETNQITITNITK